MLTNNHLEKTINEFILDPVEKLVYFVSSRVRDNNFESFESPQKIVVVTHEAKAMEKRLDDVALLGKLDYMFAF